MKAYAVLDGGGVKGAALAGALKAAEEQKIDFVGYGGTSAGSIVALLASIGYSGEAIRERLTSDVHPTRMLDDDGSLYRAAYDQTQRLLDVIKTFRPVWRELETLRILWRNRKLLRKLGQEFGLYSGEKLTQVLLELIKAKLPSLREVDDPTFSDLEAAGGKPLKIVASDTRAKRAILFSNSPDSPSQSVIQAVRASAGYPFFFKPVVHDGRRLVDGGLTSNLPSFVFSEEHELTQFPIIAFDLVSGERPLSQGVIHFLEEIADTAFEASDELIGTLLPGLKHIRITVPSNIHTLKFDLSKDEIGWLFDVGHSHTSTALNQWDKVQGSREAGEIIQKQLAVYYGPEALFRPVLEAIKSEIEVKTNAKNVRVNIMLPTGRPDGSRIVVYHFGFRETDADRALELSVFGGCSGLANRDHAPVFADLERTRDNYSTEWGMTSQQQASVAVDRRAMLSVPVFSREKQENESEVVVPIRAILSIDTSSSLEEAGWTENVENVKAVTEGVTKIAIRWAAVISKLLS
jgi:NTE family protein